MPIDPDEPTRPRAKRRRQLNGKVRLRARLRTFDDCPPISPENMGWDKGPTWAGGTTPLWAGDVFVGQRMA